MRAIFQSPFMGTAAERMLAARVKETAVDDAAGRLEIGESIMTIRGRGFADRLIADARVVDVVLRVGARSAFRRCSTYSSADAGARRRATERG